MEAVGVLQRGHGVQDDLAVDLLGERELDQDPMDFGVRVHLLDQCQQLGLVGAGGQFVLININTRRVAGLLLVFHVEFRRRIVPDQNRCQPGPNPHSRVELDHVFGNALPNALRQGFSIDQPCWHRPLHLDHAKG